MLYYNHSKGKGKAQEIKEIMVMDILTYLDTHNEDEFELYCLYRKDYPSFTAWAESHGIDLSASYTDPETGFYEHSSLYFWIDNVLEAYY